MPNKIFVCTTLSVILLITPMSFLFAPHEPLFENGISPLNDIYKKSLVAIKNVVDIKSEIKDKIDTIEEEKKELEKRRKVLRTAAKEIESIFPKNSVDVDARAQDMIKHLREFESKGLGGHQVKKSKSNKAIALGIISGVLISSVLGFVLWKGADRRSKRRSNDGVFIDTITRYIESNL